LNNDALSASAKKWLENQRLLFIHEYSDFTMNLHKYRKFTIWGKRDQRKKYLFILDEFDSIFQSTHQNTEKGDLLNNKENNNNNKDNTQLLFEEGISDWEGLLWWDKAKQNAAIQKAKQNMSSIPHINRDKIRQIVKEVREYFNGANQQLHDILRPFIESYKKL
jgi:hypothetical protein